MKIQLETIENIAKSLENIVTLMNVTNVPDLQKLSNFVKKHFGNSNLDDLEKAFEMAFIGALSVELTQTGGLNAQKIGKVMACYRDWKHQQNKALYSETEKPPPSSEEIRQLERVFENDMCIEFERYKSTRYHKFILCAFGYDYLETKGLIEKGNYLNFKGRINTLADSKKGFISSDEFTSTESAKMKQLAFNNFFKLLAINGKSLRDMFLGKELVKT